MKTTVCFQLDSDFAETIADTSSDVVIVAASDQGKTRAMFLHRPERNGERKQKSAMLAEALSLALDLEDAEIAVENLIRDNNCE